MILANDADDAEGAARVSAFDRAFESLGWKDGRNVRMHRRWGARDPARAAIEASEILRVDPQVIVANGSPAVSALQRATQRVPIVFVVVTDPLGAGYVKSLARPGANTTGFSTFAPEIGGKWLELLKGIAPDVTRVACLLDPDFKGFAAIWSEIERAGPNVGVSVSSVAFRNAGDDLESAVAKFANDGGGGLVVSPTAINNASRERIVALAARLRLPAIYPFQHFAEAGGLLVYGFDPLDLFARSAAYVDRILKGEKAGDLPVQAPTKFELIVNLRTARAMGLAVSSRFIALADRVID
jgi:putative ABC transport system substrate-binding protein